MQTLPPSLYYMTVDRIAQNIAGKDLSERVLDYGNLALKSTYLDENGKLVHNPDTTGYNLLKSIYGGTKYVVGNVLSYLIDGLSRFSTMFIAAVKEGAEAYNEGEDFVGIARDAALGMVASLIGAGREDKVKLLGVLPNVFDIIGYAIKGGINALGYTPEELEKGGDWHGHYTASGMLEALGWKNGAYGTIITQDTLDKLPGFGWLVTMLKGHRQGLTSRDLMAFGLTFLMDPLTYITAGLTKTSESAFQLLKKGRIFSATAVGFNKVLFSAFGQPHLDPLLAKAPLLQQASEKMLNIANWGMWWHLSAAKKAGRIIGINAALGRAVETFYQSSLGRWMNLDIYNVEKHPLMKEAKKYITNEVDEQLKMVKELGDEIVSQIPESDLRKYFEEVALLQKTYKPLVKALVDPAEAIDKKTEIIKSLLTQSIKDSMGEAYAKDSKMYIDLITNQLREQGHQYIKDNPLPFDNNGRLNFDITEQEIKAANGNIAQVYTDKVNSWLQGLLDATSKIDPDYDKGISAVLKSLQGHLFDIQGGLGYLPEGPVNLKDIAKYLKEVKSSGGKIDLGDLGSLRDRFSDKEINMAQEL
ncbi:MAG: hypothetical protein D6710_06825, partial [Nitrospirae bacterium]